MIIEEDFKTHFKDLARRLKQKPPAYRYVAIDTETQGRAPFDKKDALIWGRAEIVTWSLAWMGESYSYVTHAHNPRHSHVSNSLSAFRRYVLEDVPHVKVVMHNANYDLQVFYGEGLPLYSILPRKNIHCSMIEGWVADTSRPKGLKDRAAFLGRFIEATRTIDFNSEDELTRYAEQDVIATEELHQLHQFGKITTSRSDIPYNEEAIEREYLGRSNNSLKYAKRLVWYEMGVLRSVFDAQRIGFPLDLSALKTKRKQAAKQIQKIEGEIYQGFGKIINLNSAQQLGPLIEQKCGVDLPRTKTDKVSCAEANLNAVQDQHPLIGKVLNFKKWSKQLGTFLGKSDGLGLEKFINPTTGRIHCTISSIGAQTGRSSASHPNLQQIPSRTDVFKIRECFVAPDGKDLLCLDYAQLELRVMCLLARDPVMTSVLCDPNGDLHQTTADRFGVPRSPTAKQLNFLLLYGGKAYMLSMKLTEEGVPTDQSTAKVYCDLYEDTYTGIVDRRKKWVRDYVANGYVDYWIGRKRELEFKIDPRNRNSLHKAETQLSNNIVQGSGQDLLKASILRTTDRQHNWDKWALNRFSFGASRRDRERKALLTDYARKIDKFHKVSKKAHLDWHLQVHDEVIYSVDQSASAEIAGQVADIMTWEHFFPSIDEYTVPIVAEGGVAREWSNAKSGTGKFEVYAGFGKVEVKSNATKVESDKILEKIRNKPRGLRGRSKVKA